MAAAAPRPSGTSFARNAPIVDAHGEGHSATRPKWATGTETGR
jgi:hypothetical protein